MCLGSLVLMFWRESEWWAAFNGRRGKENEEIMKQLWKQMHLEKNQCIFFSFDYQNYIAGIFHNNFWYGEKLKNAERYRCNRQLIKMSHFLQHVEVITNFLSLDWDNFLVSGNIRKIEFKSVLFYYSHLNYFPLQRKPVLSWGCMKNVCVCDNFNITSNSRNWRSHRIKNVTARTGY